MNKQRRLKNGCLAVFLSELALLILAVVVLLIYSALDYDGTCISWEPPDKSCSMGEYLRQVLLLSPIWPGVLIVYYWWAALALVIVFAILGVTIGLKKTN